MLVIDDREITQHRDIPNLIDVPEIVIQRMDAADYAFLNFEGESVGIERCEIGNFLQKLRDGELESQMNRCNRDYKYVILLIEGVYDGENYLTSYVRRNRYYVPRHTFTHVPYSYILSSILRLSGMGIEIIQTPNFISSMEAIRKLYMQRTVSDEESTLFRKIRALKIPVKASANPAIPRLLALCPRMGEKVAIRLIFKFGSIWNILHAEEVELIAVEGMGRGLVDNLRRMVGYENS